MALVGNGFVTAIKFVGFLLSGSGAMLSEAIHSAADTGNQGLLLLGLVRARRAPDDKFPYGYGGERFVFGMLSASGIFFVGCTVTVLHGISGLLDPHAPRLGFATFAILAISFVIEGSVLLVAVRSIWRARGTTPLFRYVRESADPATVAILLEDGAAVLGLILAALGILMTYLTGNPVWDSIASIVVGVILGVVAIDLVAQNRALLLGKAVPEGTEDRFVQIIERRPSVGAVGGVKATQLTPEEYRFKAQITLDNEYLAAHLGKQVKAGRPLDAAMLRRIAALATDFVANEIAAIEVAIRAEIPYARHIDLEVTHPLAIEDEDDDAAENDDAVAL
ncbi:MAG: cation diffusion facilitator family transporter [Deltaproteobacteria bacterium]|nr:cation diffusion facilitator family transporter [Deltaproteobacteria bacterium]